MKLNNRGWGYVIFIACMTAISFFGAVAYHYISLFVEGMK